MGKKKIPRFITMSRKHEGMIYALRQDYSIEQLRIWLEHGGVKPTRGKLSSLDERVERVKTILIRAAKFHALDNRNYMELALRDYHQSVNGDKPFKKSTARRWLSEAKAAAKKAGVDLSGFEIKKIRN